MRTPNRPRRARIVSRHGLLALLTSDGRVPRVVIVDPGATQATARARLIEDARALGYHIDERRTWGSLAHLPRYLTALGGGVGLVALAVALLTRPVPTTPAPVASPPPIARATPVATPARPSATAPASRARVETGIAPAPSAVPSAPIPAIPIAAMPVVAMPVPVAPPLDVGPDWPPFVPYPDRFPAGPLARPGPGASSGPAAAATPATTPGGTSPADAIPLALGTARSGQLVGNRAGAFAYFAIASPAPGSTGTLAWTFDPSDPVTSLAVGVNLWQDGRLLAATSGSGAVPGQNTLAFTPSSSDPILVQLGNYAATTSVAYQIALVEPAAAPPGPAPASTPSIAASARVPLPLDTSGDGLLPGNRAGSFAYYWLPSAGAGQAQALSLVFSPGGADVGSGVFLAVYQDGQLLARGQGSGGEAPGCLTVHLTSSSASGLLVQLANYNPTGTIRYSLHRL